MGKNRSFTDYIKTRFDNTFWAVAEEYLNANIDSIDLNIRRIHRVGEFEISDVKVEHVWVEDKPDMEINFDIAISIWFIVHESDYHYDEYDEEIRLVMLHCRGDLDKNLDDFEIIDYSEYSGKNETKHPMDDSSVTFISKEMFEDAATSFLEKYYPEALCVPLLGQAPVWVDPIALAKKMGFMIKSQTIKSDVSIYGQIYFEDTTADMFDANLGKDVPTHISGHTIVVDPQMYLLRNLVSINNAIVHECVHWDKHRKAFKLEQLFNKSASCISCEVVGEAVTGISHKATEFMKMQANQLAPRI